MTPDLAAFLTARLDETTDREKRALELGYGAGEPLRPSPQFMLAVIDAKRRIIAEIVPLIDQMDAQIESEWGSGGWEPINESDKLLKLLALPYADHPDYRQEWAP